MSYQTEQIRAEYEKYLQKMDNEFLKIIQKERKGLTPKQQQKLAREMTLQNLEIMIDS